MVASVVRDHPNRPFPDLRQTRGGSCEARVLRVRDYGDDEIHVARAAKDRVTKGLIRGLKSRNIKTVPAVEFMLTDWLNEHVTSETRFQRPDSPLFPNPDGRGARWWSETSMRRTWGSAAKKAGVGA